MSSQHKNHGLGGGVVLTAFMLAGAILYNTLSDLRPNNKCEINATGGVDVTKTETRATFLNGNLRQTFQISADQIGKMSVQLTQEHGIHNSIFESPSHSSWTDTVDGGRDNYDKDFGYARNLAKDCAGKLNAKFGKALKATL